MSYHCTHCEDTGHSRLSNGEVSDYLDCRHCGAAQERADLNHWCEIELAFIGTEDEAWAIHQRARDQAYAEIVRLSKERNQAEARIVSSTDAFKRIAQAHHAALVAGNGDAGEIAKLAAYLVLAPNIDAQATRIAELEAQIAAASALAAEQQNDLIRVYDAFGFHPEGRKIGVLMTNIENVIRFANMLHAIEREFFMVAGDPEDYESGEEIEEICAVNCWGSTLPEYVEQFRGALEVKAKDACAEERRSWDLTCSEQAMEIEYLKEQQAAAPQADDTDKLRESILAMRCTNPYAEDKCNLYKEGYAVARQEAADLVASTALQAPVCEVPEDLQLVPKISTSKMDRAGEAVIEGETHCDCGNYPMPNLEKVFSAMLAAAPLPAAPVQQEGE